MAMLCGAGCATVQNPQSVENKAYAVTRIVSAKVLERHPEYRQGMETARAELEALSNAPVVGLPEIIEIVNRLPVVARTDSDAALYIEAGLLFFSDELGQVAVDNPEAVRIAASGMARALGATLGAPVFKPVPMPPRPSL